MSWVLFLKGTALWLLEEERMGCSDEQGEVREKKDRVLWKFLSVKGWDDRRRRSVHGPPCQHSSV